MSDNCRDTVRCRPEDLQEALSIHGGYYAPAGGGSAFAELDDDDGELPF